MKGSQALGYRARRGEGSRLAEATQHIYDSRLPKQFLNFGQKRTFLQATIDRLLGLVPPNRTLVVVPACHQDVAIEQLASRRPERRCRRWLGRSARRRAPA